MSTTFDDRGEGLPSALAQPPVLAPHLDAEWFPSLPTDPTPP